jgi:hypothetical protein
MLEAVAANISFPFSQLGFVIGGRVSSSGNPEPNKNLSP